MLTLTNLLKTIKKSVIDLVKMFTRSLVILKILYILIILINMLLSKFLKISSSYICISPIKTMVKRNNNEQDKDN